MVSISAYDRALEVDVNNAEAWNLKGLAYYKLKNYEKAIECCDKSVDIDPNEGMAWYNRACYLTLSGKVDEGLEALRTETLRTLERKKGSGESSKSLF